MFYWKPIVYGIHEYYQKHPGMGTHQKKSKDKRLMTPLQRDPRKDK